MADVAELGGEIISGTAGLEGLASEVGTSTLATEAQADTRLLQTELVGGLNAMLSFRASCNTCVVASRDHEGIAFSDTFAALVALGSEVGSLAVGADASVERPPRV